MSKSQGVFLQALVLMPAVRLGLRVMSFQGLHTVLKSLLPAAKRLAQVTDTDGAESPKVAGVVRVVDVASRQTVLGNTCLHRSMALWWLLGRRGIDSALRFGVRRSGDRLEAHACVECQGIVLNDRPDVSQDYLPLTSFPAKRANFAS